MKSLSHVWLFATPWTVAHQAPLSMGFSRREYWSGLPFPYQQAGSPEDPTESSLPESWVSVPWTEPEVLWVSRAEEQSTAPPSPCGPEAVASHLHFRLWGCTLEMTTITACVHFTAGFPAEVSAVISGVISPGAWKDQCVSPSLTDILSMWPWSAPSWDINTAASGKASSPSAQGSHLWINCCGTCCLWKALSSILFHGKSPLIDGDVITELWNNIYGRKIIGGNRIYHITSRFWIIVVE